MANMPTYHALVREQRVVIIYRFPEKLIHKDSSLKDYAVLDFLLIKWG